jgi:hypothetical protein
MDVYTDVSMDVYTDVSMDSRNLFAIMPCSEMHISRLTPHS